MPSAEIVYVAPERPIVLKSVPIKLVLLPDKIEEPEEELPIEELEIESTEDFSLYTPECSCMAYLWTRGIKIRGDAIDIEPNISQEEAKRGDVILLHYKYENKTIGHAAVIDSVHPGGVWISEWNYIPCEPHERFIEFSDSHIYGFARYDNIESNVVDINNSSTINTRMTFDETTTEEKKPEETPSTDEGEKTAETPAKE